MDASFRLTPVEFAALAIFLHAKSIPGLAVDLTGFDQRQVVVALDSLTEKGLMTAGEQPGTKHIDEDLLDIMTVIVAPQQVVLAHDIVGKRSIQFFVVADGIAAAVVTDKEVVVSKLAEMRDIAEQTVVFLGDTAKGRIASAVVKDDKLGHGRKAEVAGGKLRSELGTEPLNTDTVAGFLFPSEDREADYR